MKEAGKTFEDIMIEKHGKPELFDNYEKNYEQEDELPCVFRYKRAEFDKLSKPSLNVNDP